jgi:phage/plasmid-associated DNA primase
VPASDSSTVFTQFVAVSRAVADYRMEEDQIGRFISDRCRLDEACWSSTYNLYSAYTTWCDGEGEIPLEKIHFGRKLGERPELRGHRKSNGQGWQGIKVDFERGL